MWLTHQGSVRIIRHHDSSANALSTNLRTVGRKKELPRVQIPHTLPHRTPFLSILQESKLPVIAILDISGNIKLRWLQQWNTDIVDNIIKTGWVRRRCNQKRGMELQGVITCFAHKIADGFDSHILHHLWQVSGTANTPPLQGGDCGFKSRTCYHLSLHTITVSRTDCRSVGAGSTPAGVAKIIVS